MPAARASWRDVRDRIHRQILDGRYAPGDRLPRDVDLARDLGCARSTVQRAMQDLAAGGLVERRRKGGTRVRRDPVARATLDIPVTRREVEGRGGAYGYQLISRSLSPAPPLVAAALGLTSRPRMLRVESLHFSDGRPYIYEDRWVSTATVPEILAVDLAAESANEWLVRNRPFSHFALRFHAETADARIAGVMQAPPGAALLVIERATWIGAAPITFVKAVTAPGYRLLAQS